jgi:hypothetical protein
MDVCGQRLALRYIRHRLGTEQLADGAWLTQRRNREHPRTRNWLRANASEVHLEFPAVQVAGKHPTTISPVLEVIDHRRDCGQTLAHYAREIAPGRMLELDVTRKGGVKGRVRDGVHVA